MFLAINKVILGENIVLDLTGDTVTAEKLLQGYTAHKADGSLVVGTMDINGALEELLKETSSGEEEPVEELVDVLNLNFTDPDDNLITFKWPYINIEAVQADLDTLVQTIIANGIIFDYIPSSFLSATFTAADGTVTNIPIES